MQAFLSQQHTRAVFNLLDKINFNSNDLKNLAKKYKTSNKKRGEIFETDVSFEEYKKIILNSFDNEKLYKLTWKEIDAMGGRLLVDQVENKRPVVIRKQLKLYLTK